MIPQSVKKAMKVDVAVSGTMDTAIELWKDMYENHPPWKGEHAICTHIPATIAEEMARLVLTEFSIEITGGAAGTYLNEQLQRELTNIDLHVEDYCAKGGIVLKPYVSMGTDGQPGQIEVDFVSADHFYPTAYNSKKEITAGIFLEYKRMGDYLYTRAEYHQFSGTKVTIINKAFRSRKIISDDESTVADSLFNEEVPLSEVEEWAFLSETPVEINNVDKPLFVYIRVPKSNHVDPSSPLGVAIFGKSIRLIKEADRMMDKIIWEYDAKEAALLANADMIEKDEYGRHKLPKGKERLFLMLFEEGTGGSGGTGNFLDPYSPEIRDTSLFNGFNNLLKRIEWNVGFAYGTISDPALIEKTATEIRSAKERSYRTVSRIQAAWDAGLKHLTYSMNVLAKLYNLCPAGDVEVKCTWGDSVLEDTDKEFVRRMQMVGEGLLSKEAFDKWYFNCDDKALADILPKTLDDEDHIPFDLK